jgi:hypothetical protein
MRPDDVVVALPFIPSHAGTPANSVPLSETQTARLPALDDDRVEPAPDPAGRNEGRQPAPDPVGRPAWPGAARPLAARSGDLQPFLGLARRSLLVLQYEPARRSRDVSRTVRLKSRLDYSQLSDRCGTVFNRQMDTSQAILALSHTAQGHSAISCQASRKRALCTFRLI